MASASSSRVGTTVGGRYRLIERIGEGGMGVVYQAEHVDLGATVALKMVHRGLLEDEQVVSRFRREAKKAVELEHPGITQVTDLGTDDEGTPYMVMELLHGRTLESILRDGPIPIPVAVELATQVLLTLDYAHDNGVIHRDLKPANLFLARDPRRGEVRVKILDFGIAKVLDADAAEVSQTGHALGTVAYMAPEQLKSAKSVDRRADVYSMGATLFELITGKRAIEGESVFDVASRVMAGEVERKPLELKGQVPDPLIAAIRRALATSAADRYPTAGAFADALRGLAEPIDQRALETLLAARTVSKPPRDPALAKTAHMVDVPVSGVAETKRLEGAAVAKPVERSRGSRALLVIVGLVVPLGLAGTGLFLMQQHEVEGDRVGGGVQTPTLPVAVDEGTTSEAETWAPNEEARRTGFAVVAPGLPRIDSVAPLARGRAVRLYDGTETFDWGPVTLLATPDDDGRVELAWLHRARDAEPAVLEAIEVSRTLRTEVLVIDRDDGMAIARLEHVGDRARQLDGEVTVLLLELGPDETVRIRNVHRGTSHAYWSGEAPPWTRMRRRDEPSRGEGVVVPPELTPDPDPDETPAEGQAAQPGPDEELPPVIVDEIRRRLMERIGSQGSPPP